MDTNENVVVAIFEDKAAAEAAIEQLKKWDKASDDIKLGAVGLLYKEGEKVKSEIGHQSGRGLKVGALVGIIAGVLTGGVGLLGGAAAGGLMGGATGAFFAKSLNLNEAECNALGMELDLGKAAVVVTCDEYEVKSTRLTLENAGGVTKVYVVPGEAVGEAAKALSPRDITEIQEAQIATRIHDDALTQASNDLGGMV
jgi:hypothetical protein